MNNYVTITTLDEIEKLYNINNIKPINKTYVDFIDVDEMKDFCEETFGDQPYPELAEEDFFDF